MCLSSDALSSMTMRKSLTTPQYSGNPTLPVWFLEAVFSASFTSSIFDPCAVRVMLASLSIS